MPGMIGRWSGEETASGCGVQEWRGGASMLPSLTARLIAAIITKFTLKFRSDTEGSSVPSGSGSLIDVAVLHHERNIPKEINLA